MALIQLPIPDVDRTVLRPVVLSVVRDLVKRSYISADTSIRFMGELMEAQQPNTAIDNKTAPNSFGHQPQIDISVTEVFLEDHAAINSQMKTSNRFVFYDPVLGVTMNPDYTFMEVRLELRIRHRNVTESKLWRDELRNKLMAQRIVNLHKASYAYRIHKAYLVILEEIHRLRENVAGYGESLDEWLMNHFSTQVTTTTNQSASARELMVTETLNRIQGWFDFPLTPDEPEVKENKVNEEITVNYVFQYDKPTSLNFSYPIVIHNQLLSSKYRSSEPMEKEFDKHEERSYTDTNYAYFEAHTPSMPRGRPGVTIPEFDDFIPAMVLKHTTRVFTALIRLKDESPGTVLLDLNELGDYELKESVREFMKTEARYMTLPLPYMSIFQIHLYKRKEMLRPASSIQLTDELELVSTIPTSYRDYWHVRLSIVDDLSVLDPDALERLKKFPEVIDDIFNHIKPNKPKLDPSIKDKIKDYNRKDPAYRRLVGGFFIDSSFEKDGLDELIRRRRT